MTSFCLPVLRLPLIALCCVTSVVLSGCEASDGLRLQITAPSGWANSDVPYEVVVESTFFDANGGSAVAYDSRTYCAEDATDHAFVTNSMVGDSDFCARASVVEVFVVWREDLVDNCSTGTRRTFYTELPDGAVRVEQASYVFADDELLVPLNPTLPTCLHIADRTIELTPR